ncbi:MAG: succinate--CoA ligase subunit beta [Candidatus Edwardsbacteria bacterium]
MRLYEYEGKLLFRQYKISIPEGLVVSSPEELKEVDYPVVLKAQTFVGGRGKAGAIKFASNIKEAKKGIEELLKIKIHNYEVPKVLIEKKIEIQKEFYLSATIDRLVHKPLLIACAEGGMEIEEIAKEKPSAVKRYYLEPDEKINPELASRIASEMGFKGELAGRLAEIGFAIYNLFCDYECKLVEINPLVLTKDNQILAIDAKVDLDEDAMFRHPQLKEWRIEPRHEIGELTEREKIAKQAGIPYVDLNGEVGVFPGGAGFGIAAIDLIKHYGGEPANFMDSGGAPTQERLRLMLGLLMDNPKVKVIFGARFGGISRCDDWAKAVVQYVLENKPQKPMIMRMAGNMEEEGRKILQEAITQYPELFKNIKIYRYDTPIEEVIQEAVRISKRQ